MKRFIIASTTALLVTSCSGVQTTPPMDGAIRIHNLDSTDHRVDNGVAAIFCGELNGVAVMAGGGNFPDVPAADGGVKVFYSNIYTLSGDSWKLAGHLPSEAASGSSVESGDALYFIGGANSQGSLKAVTKVTLNGNGEVELDSMPDLPCGVQQAGAVMVDSVIYLMAGLQNEALSTDILSLDLRGGVDAKWQKFGEMPEPMLQPVASTYNGEIYIWGGFTTYTDTLDAKAIDYGYRFSPKDMQFTKLEGSRLGTLTGSTLEQYDGKFYMVGGVNRDIFQRAVNRRAYMASGKGDLKELEKEELEYMKLDAKGFNFASEIQIFDPSTLTWSYSTPSENYALAGAGLATVNDELIIVNGEMKPGIRTNKVWKIKFNKLK